MSGIGFIKIHRQIIDWGWYKNPCTFKLFLHLMLKANYESKYWQQEQINAGQLVTSVESLSSETGLTTREVRTALEHLKTTGEVTIKTTSRYSLITIVKWASYQSDGSESTSQTTMFSTSNRQTNDKQTTNKRQQLKKERSEEVKNDSELPVATQIKELIRAYANGDNELEKLLNEWVAMRKSLKKPIASSSGFKHSLRDLSALGGDLKEHVRIALSRSWQGFYAVNNQQQKSKQKEDSWTRDLPII